MPGGPGFTAKGFPYSLGGNDAPTIDNTMEALARAVDAWFDPLTTAQRDLLTTAQKPDGRIIFNLTTRHHEYWDVPTLSWKQLIPRRRSYSIL